MPRVMYDENVMVSNMVEEDIPGTMKFSFWNIVSGLFGDLTDLSERINEATNSVYTD